MDGKNDVFKPLNMGNVIGYKMTVWNRWGQKVFYTNQVQKGWDGNSNGKLQMQGTYVYFIEFNKLNGFPVQLKGYVNLLR